jgi:hypothetical protein
MLAVGRRKRDFGPAEEFIPTAAAQKLFFERKGQKDQDPPTRSLPGPTSCRLKFGSDPQWHYQETTIRQVEKVDALLLRARKPQVYFMAADDLISQ